MEGNLRNFKRRNDGAVILTIVLKKDAIEQATLDLLGHRVYSPPVEVTMPCPHCKAKGKRKLSRINGKDGILYTCSPCKGTGKL